MIVNFELHESEMNLQPFIFHIDELSGSETITGYSNWHENIEIICILEGKGFVFFNGEKTPVKKGDICIINSNVLHSFSPESNFRYYCLIPDSEFFSKNGIELYEMEFSPIIHDATAAEMITDFSDCFYSSDPLKEAKLRAKLLELLIYIAENHCISSASNNSRPKTVQCVRSSVNYIKAHLGEKITIDQLASSANISKYHFLRIFKKLTGDTPIVFINKMRCETAKKFLASGSYSISEICEKCGFENLSYFSKVFKSYTSMTPKDYQKNGQTKLPEGR